jgi:NAD(P)-dependent dehydrogenase (short-subunit alcohol dehydrogenase family)
VVILGSTAERVEEAVGSLRKTSPETLGFSGSVLDRNHLEEVQEAVMSKWGRIDALVNAAGGNMPGATISENETIFDLDLDDFDTVTRLNLNGTVIPSIVFGRAMADRKEGSVINISSMTATQAVTRVVGYSASKAAIDNFTRWMAVEMASKFSPNIRVNAIAPGFFIANQNRRLLMKEDGSYTGRGKAVIDKTPMKRFGEPEELNGALHWLISDASSFVTGTIVSVDGGFSAFSGV